MTLVVVGLVVLGITFALLTYWYWRKSRAGVAPAARRNGVAMAEELDVDAMVERFRGRAAAVAQAQPAADRRRRARPQFHCAQAQLELPGLRHPSATPSSTVEGEVLVLRVDLRPPVVGCLTSRLPRPPSAR